MFKVFCGTELRMASKIENISKQNNNFGFTSDTHQRGTSEQSLIGTGL